MPRIARDQRIADESLYELLHLSLGSLLTGCARKSEREEDPSRVPDPYGSLLYSLEKADLVRLFRILEVLSRARSARVALHALVKEVTDLLAASHCCLIFLDPRGETGTVAASHESRTCEGLTIRLDRHPEIRRSVETGEITIVKNPVADPLMSSLDTAALRRAKAHSILVLPLVYEGKVFGALHVRKPVSKRGFTVREIRTCKIMLDLLIATLQRMCKEILDMGKAGAFSQRSARKAGVRESLSNAAGPVLESLPIGLLLVGPDRSILFANREIERITGIPRKELLGLRFQDIVADHLVEEIRSMRRSCGDARRTLERYHVALRSRDGSPRHVSVETRRMPGENNMEIVAFRDVTREKELNEELQERNRELTAMNQALSEARGELLQRNEELRKVNERLEEVNRLKTHFMAVATHEIRTPLTVVMGYTRLLASGKLGVLTREQKKVLADTEKNCERLLSIINGVLDLSKIEAGKMEVNPREGDIVEVVRRVYRQMRIIADRSRLGLRLKAPRRPLRGFFDPDRVEQVLMNLISNAIKFTPEGGTIEVAVASRAEGRDGESLQISVSDTGKGLPREMLDRVFDEFHQISPQRSLVGEKGTGLGLAISKKIVEAHGGRIWAESEEGKGSTFCFILPLSDDAAGGRHDKVMHEKAYSRSRRR